jgi:hypothetical protein
MRCSYQGRTYVQKQCKFFRRCMSFHPHKTGACNYMLIWVHEWQNACRFLFRCWGRQTVRHFPSNRKPSTILSGRNLALPFSSFLMETDPCRLYVWLPLVVEKWSGCRRVLSGSHAEVVCSFYPLLQPRCSH